MDSLMRYHKTPSVLFLMVTTEGALQKQNKTKKPILFIDALNDLLLNRGNKSS